MPDPSQAGQPALERIDVVLTCDHDEDIAFLVSHSKRALRVIRQNVTIALATKFAFLVFAVFGAAPLWLAVMADTGATVVVTLNGLQAVAAQGSGIGDQGSGISGVRVVTGAASGS